MSTKSNDTADEPNGDWVEISNLTIVRRGDKPVRAKVRMTLETADGLSEKNTLIFETGGRVASFDYFEKEVGSLETAMKMIPAAEAVVATSPDIEGVIGFEATVNDALDAGEKAVENRLRMTNVPPDLKRGWKLRQEQRASK